MSRRAGRALINHHHQLEKQRWRAAAGGDRVAEAAVEAQMARRGGLDLYQQASLLGQSLQRGGDSSKLLLEWLPLGLVRELPRRPRMLEVGSLSTCNSCASSGLFDMVHIDLQSQGPGILQQDFMQRPLPRCDADSFDLISLSLVLNFVPDAAGRGQMLARTLSFLRPARGTLPGPQEAPFPSLFIVLPRSCITNSRYFSADRFRDLMAILGYEPVRTKTTQKLVYSLWTRIRPALSASLEFDKKEVNPGRNRNNFTIILKSRDALQPP